MTTLVSRPYRRANWQSLCMVALGFWLSASIVFDFLIVPSLFTSGMMESSDFPSFSYLVFGNFNHLELLSAAIVLGFTLAINYLQNSANIRFDSSLVISITLMGIALLYTYIFTPQMSAMGMNLDQFSVQKSLETSMVGFHLAYWFLELSKLTLGTLLLSKIYSDSCKLNAD